MARYNSCIIFSMQAVYNANKFASLVRKRDRLQNWLDYNQLKFERKPEKRPTTKVVYTYTDLHDYFYVFVCDFYQLTLRPIFHGPGHLMP